MIKLRNISKSYNGKQILKDINLDIKEGEIISIIGKSGSGKSTLLRCIALLEDVDKGEISFDNHKYSILSEDLTNYRRNVSMVFQKYNLFSNMTVLENIMLAPVVTKFKTENEAKKDSLKLLKYIGLEDKKNAYPHQLSGGEQQRVAIIRALAMDPKYLLLDEVTSALDPEMVKEVLLLIKKLANEGISVVIVTHQINFAKEISDKMIFIDEGTIKEESSSKDFFENPKDKNLKSFLDKIIM